MKPVFSIIAPIYNEKESMPELYRRVSAVMDKLGDPWELILVSDGCSDGSTELILELAAKDPRVRPVIFARNFGHQIAATAGLDYSRGDAVIIIDADLQDPPEVIADLVAKWREGYEVVYAVRAEREGESWFKLWTASLFYQLIFRITDVKIPMDTGDFRLMDRKVVEALKSLPERNRFMKGLYAWVGFNSTAIDYQPLPRTDGKSNFGLRGSLSLALTGILAFSIAPLRALTLVGLVLSALALGYGAWVVGEYFVTGIAVPGYATIVVGMMFFSGIQLLSIGVLAEYVGRIYEEVKQCPTYLISQRQGRGLLTSDPSAPTPTLQDEQEASLL